jgi:hypothetical protein
MTLFSTGNLAINSASDSGERLQVTGTAKITGATTIGGYTSITNAGGGPFTSQLTLTNSTSSPSLIAFTNTINGFAFGFNSTTTQRFVFINGGAAEIASIAGTGVVSFTNIVGISTSNQSTNRLRFTNTTSNNVWELVGGLNAANNTDFSIYDSTNNISPFRISPATGAITMSGNLTVDTNTLFVDATNNRVGVLTTTPSSAFQIGGTAGNTGVLQYTITSASPVSNQLLFGTDGTGYQFAIGKNQAGTISNLVYLQDNGNLGVGISPAYRLDVSGSARVSDAIAIGTTPDTNNPFKILKNLNTTVGIKFENTNTSSLSFSAVQLGNDITGGTAFTNLVYGSSGITESGVYKPSGTALINTGSGGLNFLAVSQPIRFFTSTGNGTERVRIKNEGHVRFVPLSAAPTTNVEAGDVYYDSTTNKLRCYNGTSWNDLF